MSRNPLMRLHQGIAQLLNIHQRLEILLAAAVLLRTVAFICALMNLMQIIMMILQDCLIVSCQHHNADGGAMVRGTLQMVQRIHKHQTGSDGAGTGLQALGMAVLQDHNHIVDGFFQGLNCFCRSIVIIAECMHCNFNDLINSTTNN